MEGNKNKRIEDILPDYFSGEISEEEQQKVKDWRNQSSQNLKTFNQMAAAWESRSILETMEQFDTPAAFSKIDKRLLFHGRVLKAKNWAQKVAAILILPLLVYSGYLTYSQLKTFRQYEVSNVWQKLKTSSGMISEIELPDGTRVWLNSETKLEYPAFFGDTRQVKLNGEAYFEVKKDKAHPFIVNTGNINVEVLGTSFNVLNFASENKTEVTLKEGKVELFTGAYEQKKTIEQLAPDQQAIFDRDSKELQIKNVIAENYSSWKDGILMFVDEPMDDVVRKLSRWFNMEFVLESDELRDYIYRATFKDENYTQVLELLKLSAPIEYQIEPRKQLLDGNYSKVKVLIRKR